MSDEEATQSASSGRYCRLSSHSILATRMIEIPLVLDEIRKAKRNNPDNKIIVTGCAAQINPNKYNTIKEVDLVLGNKEKLLSNKWSNF